MNTRRSTRQARDLGRAFRAFTLLDLLCLTAVLVFLGSVLAPAITSTRAPAQSLQCARNLRTLTLAWQMYAEDHGGKLAVNVHGGANATPGRWASGWLDWSVSTDNTNVLLLTKQPYSALGQYVAEDAAVYKCPSDTYLSLIQKLRFPQRCRSYSMNMVVGEGNATMGPWDSAYRQVTTTSEFIHPGPAESWVFTEEHPDSINDPAFFAPVRTEWVDVPAPYHNGGTVLSFADGHTELHLWRGSLTNVAVRQVRTLELVTRIPVPPNDSDISWVRYRSPRVRSTW